MGSSLALLFLPLLVPQQPSKPIAAPATANKLASPDAPLTGALDSGLVLVRGGLATGHGFRLGTGGVAANLTDLDELPGDAGYCTTPGGVQVICRREGVKLTFASGREVLVAPDGYLHLRDGSHVGPFEGGVELRLLDGTGVRIDRSGSRRQPVTAVDVVVDGGAEVRLWERGEAVSRRVRGNWSGERLFCFGDGDVLYRALALGPLVTLRRELAPLGSTLPTERVAVLVDPFAASLRLLLDSRARFAEPGVVEQIKTLLANIERALPTEGVSPVRTDTQNLRFLVRSGYDLSIDVASGEVTMRLAPHEGRPFVEWSLGYGAGVRCLEGSSQQIGGVLTLPNGDPMLQPRLERLELAAAVQTLQALAGTGRVAGARR